MKYTSKRKITHLRVYIFHDGLGTRLYSLVRRIKTEFRSSLSTERVTSLIGYHFNKRCYCCELSLFILMNLFLLKESHVLMIETRAINISIFKTIVFVVNFLFDVIT